MRLPFVSRKKYDEIVYKLECLLCHATGGRLSKSGYDLKDMCRTVDYYIDECIDERDEIVRCKDCIHARNMPLGLCFLHTEPYDNEKGYKGDAVCVDPDDFCSYGEKREP